MKNTSHDFDANFDDLASTPRGQKDTSRALRRHHVDRLKAVRSKHQLVQGSNGENPSEKRVGMHVHTAAICSCTSCGNPRKRLGHRTIPELRVMQRVRPWATNK